MRKFWGWSLFLVAWLDAGIIWYNFALAPWKDGTEFNGIWLAYLVIIVLCSFGWYRLAICKPKKED